MRMLLTGASGFIGRNLAGSLALNSDHEVTALVRTFPQVENSRQNLRYLRADLSRPGWTDNLPSEIDVVCHLAQSGRYRDFPGGAQDMMAVNVDATFELLEWARRENVKKFIFTSTGNVYAPSKNPLREDDPLRPSSLYGATKASAEMIVSQYGQLFSCSVLRLFGVYGPGQTGMLVPGMIDRIRNGGRISLAGGIGLRFTPLYIEDCLDIFAWIIDGGPTSTGVSFFNCCGSETVTLRQVVDRLGELMGIEPKTESAAGEFASLVGENRKLVEAMRYSPRTGYLSGLKKTLDG